MRWLFLSMVGFGLLLMLFGIYHSSQNPANRSVTELEFETTEVYYNELPIGDNRITIKLKNNSNTPKRVLGFNEACGSACLKSELRGSTTLQPGEAIDYPFILSISSVGEYYADIVMMLESTQGIEKVTIKATGIASP